MTYQVTRNWSWLGKPPSSHKHAITSSFQDDECYWLARISLWPNGGIRHWLLNISLWIFHWLECLESWQLPPPLLILPPRPPSSSLSLRADDATLQGHIIGSEWLAYSLIFWVKSNFFFRYSGLTSSHVLFVLRWHHRITSRCSQLKSFPINRIPHDTKTMCHSALAFPSIF